MAGMSVSYSAARKCRLALCHSTCGLHNITVGGCLGLELLAAEQIKLKFCADICAATSEILAAAEHLGKLFCAPWTPPALAPASLRAILNVLGGHASQQRRVSQTRRTAHASWAHGPLSTRTMRG
jgi:hypothetical protein